MDHGPSTAPSSARDPRTVELRDDVIDTAASALDQQILPVRRSHAKLGLVGAVVYRYLLLIFAAGRTSETTEALR
jgi:hypothetical protein